MPEFLASMGIAKTHKWSQKQMTSALQHVCYFDSPMLLGYLLFKCVSRVNAPSDVQTLKTWHWSVAGGELYTLQELMLFPFCILEFLSHFFSKPNSGPILFATEFCMLDKFTQKLHRC